MDVQKAELPNHREHRRQRTLIGGKLVYGDTAITVDCVVYDMSESGARIKIPLGPILPSKVWLIEPRLAVAREAEIKWRRHPFLGLHFIRAENMNEGSSAYGRLLRAIWLETQPRA